MTFFIFYRTAQFLCIHLPLRLAYALGISLSLLKYYVSPRDRRAVCGNLKRILPESKHRRIRVYARKVFVEFGKYLVEFLRFSLLSKEDLGRFVKIKGIEYVDNALKQNKGVIILTAHIGNWELGGVLMGLLGYPMVAVALPHRSPLVNAFFNRQRLRLGKGGMDVIPSSGIRLRKVYEALRSNSVLALVGDRDFAKSGKSMPFLGASKIIPRGPAALSLRTGAPIVPGFVTRQEDGTQLLEFSEPLPSYSTEEETSKACCRVIEERIRKYPEQWLMFREFWKE